jgi:adenosylcobinamide amidohydrolase
MVTAAKIQNFSLVKKKQGDLAVSVVVTAGCSHAESAGEKMGIQEIMGTINVIVVVDGNPSESCMVAALATAVEAKAAAMRDLDIRSRYSGDAATGTITDSLVVAATTAGEAISYGGPASDLGQLVGYCVRKAVKEAVTNQGECLPCRSVADRLRERYLPLEKIACELEKIKGLGMDKVALASSLAKVLDEKPFFASLLLSAVKIDEDVERGLVPPEFGKIEVLSEHLGEFLSKESGGKTVKKAEREAVDLPPFLREVLVAFLKSGVSGEKSARLK